MSDGVDKDERTAGLQDNDAASIHGAISAPAGSKRSPTMSADGIGRREDKVGSSDVA